MPGDLGYDTLPVTDLTKGMRFYGGLFGWRFAPGEDYAHIENTGPPGGLARGPGDTAQLGFTVADMHAALARVRELGCHADEAQQSDSGWGVDCRDDQGTRFSLWQPAADCA